MDKKIEKYLSFMEVRTRADGTRFAICKDNAPEELREAIREAHGDRFLDDFIYGAFMDLLQSMSEYDMSNSSELDEYRGEIVDSQVDVYTAGLTKWLAEDINNVYYLTRAIEEYEARDGFKALSTAQYIAYDEVYGAVQALLEGDNDE